MCLYLSTMTGSAALHYQKMSLNAQHDIAYYKYVSLKPYTIVSTNSEITQAQLRIATICVITLYMQHFLTPTYTVNSISSEAREALTFETPYCILTLSIRMTIISAL